LHLDDDGDDSDDDDDDDDSGGGGQLWCHAAFNVTSAQLSRDFRSLIDGCYVSRFTITRGCPPSRRAAVSNYDTPHRMRMTPCRGKYSLRKHSGPASLDL